MKTTKPNKTTELLTAHPDLPLDVVKYIKALAKKAEHFQDEAEKWETTWRNSLTEHSQALQERMRQGIEAGRAEVGLDEPEVIAFIEAYTTITQRNKEALANLESKIEDLNSKIDRRAPAKDYYDDY